MARTRVGFTGAGIIANRHLGNLLHFDDVEVVGVADLDGARATALAARCDATPYTSQTEMLARESLDAVYVCVPPFAHGAPELECVEQGVPFFVEKPIAADWETAAA